MLLDGPRMLDSSFQLTAEELPTEHALADTRFAMYYKITDSHVVIFSDSIVGLECWIGASKWYILAEFPVPMPLHKVGKVIDYKYKDGWVKE